MTQLEAGPPGCVRLVIRRLRVRPPPSRQHSFMKTDQEIFAIVILSLQLIQEGHVSAYPVKVVR